MRSSSRSTVTSTILPSTSFPQLRTHVDDASQESRVWRFFLTSPWRRRETPLFPPRIGQREQAASPRAPRGSAPKAAPSATQQRRCSLRGGMPRYGQRTVHAYDGPLNRHETCFLVGLGSGGGEAAAALRLSLYTQAFDNSGPVSVAKCILSKLLTASCTQNASEEIEIWHASGVQPLPPVCPASAYRCIPTQVTTDFMQRNGCSVVGTVSRKGGKGGGVALAASRPAVQGSSD